ncbi:MAG: hypothetical protein ACRENP_23120, partial [Longimicrobiales bacterium]
MIASSCVTLRAIEKADDEQRPATNRRRANAPKHELLLPIEQNQGLAALPTPSQGDLFFDLEGDPYALTYGIEY